MPRRAPCSVSVAQRTRPVTPAASCSKLDLKAAMAASLRPLAFIFSSKGWKLACECVDTPPVHWRSLPTLAHLPLDAQVPAEARQAAWPGLRRAEGGLMAD